MLRRPDKKFGINSYSRPAYCKGVTNFYQVEAISARTPRNWPTY